MKAIFAGFAIGVASIVFIYSFAVVAGEKQCAKMYPTHQTRYDLKECQIYYINKWIPASYLKGN